ncbi:MAG: hypothetical protein ACO31Z_05055 [Litorivicinaceae bacterium]
MTEKTGTCGCGRSPTGDCIGWHKLSEAEYQAKLDAYQRAEAEKAADPSAQTPE